MVGFKTLCLLVVPPLVIKSDSLIEFNYCTRREGLIDYTEVSVMVREEEL